MKVEVMEPEPQFCALQMTIESEAEADALWHLLNCPDGYSILRYMDEYKLDSKESVRKVKEAAFVAFNSQHIPEQMPDYTSAYDTHGSRLLISPSKLQEFLGRCKPYCVKAMRDSTSDDISPLTLEEAVQLYNTVATELVRLASLRNGGNNA